AARELIERLLGAQIAEVAHAGSGDAKTALQERAQAGQQGMPEYRLVAESGPPHDRTFEIAVLVDGRELARADGKSKKSAEQRAAALALLALDGAGTPGPSTPS